MNTRPAVQSAATVRPTRPRAIHAGDRVRIMIEPIEEGVVTVLYGATPHMRRRAYVWTGHANRLVAVDRLEWIASPLERVERVPL